MNLQTDLTNCDKEQIQIPGFIQCHGLLVAIDYDLIIRFCSDNIGQFIPGATSKLTGHPFSAIQKLLKEDTLQNFINNLSSSEKTNEHLYKQNPFNISLSGSQFHLILSYIDNYYILEFEPAASDETVRVDHKLGTAVNHIFSAKKINLLLQNAAEEVKDIINYDRVMIYKFGIDGHGEVIAEARNEEQESWLGLHYPASDIPKQARELYKLNLTRFIADVGTTPSMLIAEDNSAQLLNLTYTQLRAVSLIHIQYLKNMGVASSFSISLIYKGELWGLIACHNYTARFIDYKSRESSKIIGQILSTALEFMEKEENNELQELFEGKRIQLNHFLLNNTSIKSALTAEQVTMLNITNASGAILVYDNSIEKLGITPNDSQLEDLLSWIRKNVKELTFYTTNLIQLYPPATNFIDIACGMLLITISKELGEYAIWFKPQVHQTVSWAGDPNKPVEANKEGIMQLSPRRSFETWQEHVSGTSLPWAPEEIKSASHLKEELLYAINVKSNAIKILNENLKKAYEELDTFSYTVSHDLKSPITAIKVYTDMMHDMPGIPDNMLELINRVTGRINKMTDMVNEILNYTHKTGLEIIFEMVDIRAIVTGIISDLDLEINEHNITITLGKTPDLFGDRVMLTQVFNNLINNAIKYSGNTKAVFIHITGETIDDHICYSISDNGIGIAPENLSLIFGLFNRMANPDKIEGSGVGLAIVKRIVEKHNGRIWVESELGKGSVFYMSFNKKNITQDPINLK